MDIMLKVSKCFKGWYERYAGDGDLTLVGADGVAFRVYRHHLSEDSSFFRDSPLMKPDDAIDLDDASIEYQHSIAVCLDSMVRGKTASMLPDRRAHTFAAFRFADKYDCVRLKKRLRRDIAAGIRRDPVAARDAFVLGGSMGDAELCGGVIAASAGCVFPAAGNGKEAGPRSQAASHALDASGWSARTLASVEPELLSALLRANRLTEVDYSPATKAHSKLMAEQFNRITKI